MMKPKDAECPLSPQSDRGHQSLEELRLFTPFSWHWVPGDGWETGAASNGIDDKEIFPK
jgi:hypothetical protein